MIIFELITVMSTGLLAGALLTEAFILVPHWKRMPPEKFLQLHHTMAPSLYQYFAPLTIIGTALPILTFAVVCNSSQSNWAVWLISAVCAVGLLSFYLFFFRKANLSFSTTADAAIAERTLSKWAILHNLRTFIALVGFVAAITASISA